MKRLVLTVAILISLAAPAWAGFAMVRLIVRADAIGAAPLTLSGAKSDEGMAAFNRGEFGKAMQEFRVKAEQGDGFAAFMIAQLYSRGLGVEKNSAIAFEWYRRGANLRLPAAMNNLAVAYTRGYGTPRNYVRAHMWWNLYAAESSEGRLRSDATKQLERLEARMTPADISKAQKLAREWWAKKEGK